MSAAKLNAPHIPSCADCGRKADVHAVPRPDTLPGTSVSIVWLCGSCEYLRDNPCAERVRTTRAPKEPQAETLL